MQCTLQLGGQIHWPCFISCNDMYSVVVPMTLKARGLAQHGGPSGWLQESDQTNVFRHVMDGPHRLPFPYRTGCPDRSCTAASWWNFQLLLYCKCTVNNHPSWATSRKEGMACNTTVVDPCLLSGKSSGSREYPHPLHCKAQFCAQYRRIRIWPTSIRILRSLTPKPRCLNNIDRFSWFSIKNHIYFSCMQVSLL